MLAPLTIRVIGQRCLERAVTAGAQISPLRPGLALAPIGAGAVGWADMTTDLSAHVSAAEAARLCGLSEKTVRRWIKAGKLRADKIDGAYSVVLDEVSALAGRMGGHLSAPGTDTSTDSGVDTCADSAEE